MLFQKLGASEYCASYSVNPQDSFDEFGRPVVFEFLKSQKDYSIEQNGVDLPVEIFSMKISALRAIVKYLVEIKSLTFSQIATLLGRDPRTIWTSYNVTKGKKSFKSFLLKPDRFVLNTQIFKNSKLSVLENISYALKEKSLSLKEISSILNKSPKTIWTVLSRAEKKLALSKNLDEKAGGVRR